MAPTNPPSWPLRFLLLRNMRVSTASTMAATAAASTMAATAGGLAGLCLLRCRRAASTFRAGGGVAFETLDVFTTRRFGGNPLAIVYDEEKQLTAAQMQSIAAEFGYSETTFVLPPSDEANTAHVRIFSPTYEMPFAGHPNVGTATALAWRGNFMGRPVGHTVRFEEKAGLVLLNILHDAAGQPTGAMLTAPEPFSLPVPSLPVKDVAAAVSLEPSELVVSNHPPLVATTGLPFIVAECASLDALARSRGAPAAFEELCALDAVPPKVLLYTHTGAEEGEGAPAAWCTRFGRGCTARTAPKTPARARRTLASQACSAAWRRHQAAPPRS